MQLNVDIRMVDRLEQFAFAFINRPKIFDHDVPSTTQGRTSQRRYVVFFNVTVRFWKNPIHQPVEYLNKPVRMTYMQISNNHLTVKL